MNYLNNYTNNPTLIEPGVKYFIGGTLKECSSFKKTYVNVIFNVAMTALFLTIVSVFLIYKYKGKLTLNEQKIKNNQKQEYILSKLQQLNMHKKQQEKQETNKSMITDLPHWDY
jgi:hypothetical protein